MTSLGVAMSPDKLKSMIAEVEAIYHAYTLHTHTLHTHTHTQTHCRGIGCLSILSIYLYLLISTYIDADTGDETDFPEFCLLFFFKKKLCI